jgi:GT2 family glycosyltransferase
MPSEVDVVIVTYNSAQVVADLLDSLPDALGKANADIVVVDNGSQDDTVKLLQRRADCRVIQSTNVGYAAGINRGVKEASGAPAILVLNPDIRLHEQAVGPLLETLLEPRTGVVAPRILSAAGELEFSLRRTPSLPRALGLSRTKIPMLSEYVQEPAAYSHPHTVDWALGAALMISRECFNALGGWDETYFLYSEETDFSLRAWDLGLATRFEPRSVAVHIGGASGRNNKTHAMQIVNRVRLYRRRHSTAAAWGYFWLTIASEATWVARGHRQSRSAIAALLRPSLRPTELGCSRHLLPG